MKLETPKLCKDCGHEKHYHDWKYYRYCIKGKCLCEKFIPLNQKIGERLLK